jgi:hypothetical protein
VANTVCDTVLSWGRPMQARSWVTGLAGLLATAVAVGMAWDFLAPPRDYSDSLPDNLSISIEARELDDPTSLVTVRVEHHVEAEWEYVFISSTGLTDAVIEIWAQPGEGTSGAPWYCASGIQTSASGSPSPFKLVQPGANQWKAGKAFDIGTALEDAGIPPTRARWTADREGVTCQRTDPIFTRMTQGLVLLGAATIRSTSPAHVQSSLAESIDVPPTWELFGRERSFSTSERFGPPSTNSRPYSFISSPDRATQSGESDAIGGIHLARDVVAESEAARLAWISALIGGGGIAAMFAAADHLLRRRTTDPPEHGPSKDLLARADENARLRGRSREVTMAAMPTLALALALLSLGTLFGRSRKT